MVGRHPHQCVVRQSKRAYTVDESGRRILVDCLYMIPELVRWHVGGGR